MPARATILQSPTCRSTSGKNQIRVIRCCNCPWTSGTVPGLLAVYVFEIVKLQPGKFWSTSFGSVHVHQRRASPLGGTGQVLWQWVPDILRYHWSLVHHFAWACSQYLVDFVVTHFRVDNSICNPQTHTHPEARTSILGCHLLWSSKPPYRVHSHFALLTGGNGMIYDM